MKIQRIVLFPLALFLVLSMGGCGRSHTATPAPRSVGGKAALSAPRREAFAATGVTVATATPVAIPTAQPAPVATRAPRPQRAAAQPSPAVEPTAASPLSRTVNVLVLGSDRRPREGDWRTDVLMLIALDLEGKQAGAISFPRDIYIDEIPGHQPNKINVVDFLGEQDEPGGGPALLASILQEKIGVPIDYYLRFDFASFEQVVDALGGVELTVDCRAYEYLPEEDISLYLEPGVNRLDGRTALGYVRARNQGGDLERARRQQRMVWAVRNQLLSENQLPNLPALYTALHGSVQTDIGFVDAIRLARFALALAEEDLHGMVISPPDLVQPDWRRGMSVFIADWPSIAERVQTIFDRPPLAQTNTVGAGGDRVQCP